MKYLALLILLTATAHAEEFTPPPHTTKVIGIKVDKEWQAFVFVTSTGDIKAAQLEECLDSKACRATVKKLKSKKQCYIMMFLGGDSDSRHVGR